MISLKKYDYVCILLLTFLALGTLNCGGSPSSPTTSQSTTSSNTPDSGTNSGSGSGTSSGGSSSSGSGSGSNSGSGGSGGSNNGTSGTPSNGNQPGTTFSNLHQKKGWTGYGLLPAAYSICGSCKPSGPQVTWAMTQGVKSPSQTGNSTQFQIGGKTLYADVLWNNHLIGDYSSQGLPDTDHKLVPTLHNFTYDVYFYVTSLSDSQALEFDINQFVDGKSFIWGHECRVGGGNEWDIWDDVGKKWHPTGVSCYPKNNSWNHVVIQVQRTSDDKLLFQSITLNGKQANLNYKEDPTDTNWYGVTINYQQDGNGAQKPYSIWLDQLNFSYW
jgi:hypothetical protein